MESGLEDRNNSVVYEQLPQVYKDVSMESGLEDRNNQTGRSQGAHCSSVSMESGLEDRNNGLGQVRNIAGPWSQWSPA